LRIILIQNLEDSDMDDYIDSLIKLKQRQYEFENIYPAHGEYPLSRTFIDSVLSGFKKIRAGAAPDKIIADFGTKTQFYQFDGFSIFLKAPGETGVKLS
jgi:hydroxyacylglutathione hydrolase